MIVSFNHAWLPTQQGSPWINSSVSVGTSNPFTAHVRHYSAGIDGG
jgi:hypothetical protein